MESNRGKVKQRGESQRRHLTGDLSIRIGAADLVGNWLSRKNIPDVGERLIHHEPGFLDAKPECGGGTDLLGRHFAGEVARVIPITPCDGYCRTGLSLP